MERDQKKVIAEGMRRLFLLRRIIIGKATADIDIHQGQQPKLEYIDQHDGCMQVQAAEEMMVSPASMALTTKRMEKAGLVEKRIDAGNLRCKRLSITPKGRELSVKCRKVHDAFEQRMLEGFDSEELGQLAGYLRRMVCNISGEEDDALASRLTIRGLEERMEKSRREGKSV